MFLIYKNNTNPNVSPIVKKGDVSGFKLLGTPIRAKNEPNVGYCLTVMSALYRCMNKTQEKPLNKEPEKTILLQSWPPIPAWP